MTCEQCHFGIASSLGATGTPSLVVANGLGPALHVNGTTDVVFRLGGSYGKDNSFGSCSNTACHGTETKSWPR
jgi:hypothetical protein